jgi:ribonuclease HII
MLGVAKKISGDLKKDFFEKDVWKKFGYACGIDEVGRGSLCGPLVVSAVVLPQNTYNPLLMDSKVLTEYEREQAYEWIVSNCIYTVTFASAEEIDNYNIYRATLRMMKQSCIQVFELANSLRRKCCYILVDAMPLHLRNVCANDDLKIYYFNKGESKSSSIAAASIIAKVTRDRLMKKIDNYFPQFYVGQNKGYATKKHIDVLQMFGLSLIHRVTFVKNFIKKDKSVSRQQSIATFCRNC